MKIQSPIVAIGEVQSVVRKEGVCGVGACVQVGAIKNVRGGPVPCRLCRKEAKVACAWDGVIPWSTGPWVSVEEEVRQVGEAEVPCANDLESQGSRVWI